MTDNNRPIVNQALCELALRPDSAEAIITGAVALAADRAAERAAAELKETKAEYERLHKALEQVRQRSISAELALSPFIFASDAPVAIKDAASELRLIVEACDAALGEGR